MRVLGMIVAGGEGKRMFAQVKSDCDYRVAEIERRVKAAEERARQEAEARKVFEDQLHRVRPLK